MSFHDLPQFHRWAVHILFYTISTWSLVGGSAIKPEKVILDFLAKPFAPSEWASDECLRDSAIYLSQLADYSPWALKMYDASSKIAPGVITGNYRQLGNYDECLQVQTGHGFTGKACSYTVQFEIAEDDGAPREPDLGDLLRNMAIASDSSKWTFGNSVTYEWMWCVPSSCNNSEIGEAIELALDPLKVEGRVDMVVNVAKDSCHTMQTDQSVFVASDWIYISILAIFALIIVISTCYDVVNQGHLRTLNRKDTQHALLTSFSFYTNCKNLLRTERHRGAIECLDGIRYISICWIIYGHTYYNEAVGVKMNLTEVPRMHINWANMLVLNGTIATDTFFLLSGLLLAYTEIAKKERTTNWRFNPIGLYVHRYLRLTPAYAMMIGFYATLFYKFGSGPHWNLWVGSNRDYCRVNWWTNLLYVNNYVNLPTMCMSQSWYLATDMQFVWLSPIILYPMLKFTQGILLWLLLASAIFVSILPPFLITYFLRLTGTMLYYKELPMVAEVYQQIYTRAYNRFGPYVIGLTLGYILYKTRSRSLKIPGVYVVCGWIVATLAGLSVVFGPRAMYFDDHHYSRVEAGFYAGFHRQVFALSVSWIIFCSFHGYAGLLGHFFSWKGWIPLSKLTYSAYLCHYVILLSDAGSVRTSGTLTQINIVRVFLSNLCLTMLLSAIWSLCFEIPFMIIDRTLISRNKYPSAKQDQEKMSDSNGSTKAIYRSTEETFSTVSRSFNDEVNVGVSNDGSVYNSPVSVGYRREGDEEENIRRDGDPREKREDGSFPCAGYVIDSKTRKCDPSAWSKIREEKLTNYGAVGVNGNYNENLNQDPMKFKTETNGGYSNGSLDTTRENSRVDLQTEKSRRSVE